MKTLSNAIEHAWYHGAIWYWPFLVILWPLSILFRCMTRLRRIVLQGIVLQGKHAALPVPVVVIGNISVGGTGKTPLLCEIAIQLSARGKRAGIISRGYGGSYDGEAYLLQSTDQAARVGDEPLLMAQLTGCPVVIGHDRYAAAKFLLQNTQVDIILSDDGLQHYALPRTVEIAVLDAARGTGNGFCLPAGPLREAVSRLDEVDFVVVNGDASTVFQKEQLITKLVPEKWIAVASRQALALDIFCAGTQVHAVAGIGNPQRFFASLRDMGLHVIEHVFPDHHAYSPSDLLFPDALPVVMTEKDAVKCVEFAKENCYALRVKMALPAFWVSRLLDKVEDNFRRER
jgi:tetraacyldisaccharide 4'-kinase